MFKQQWFKPRAVVSDEGFKVEMKGPNCVRYEEGRIAAHVNSEQALIQKGKFAGKMGWLVDLVHVHITAPNEPQTSDADRIRVNLIQALDYLEIPYYCEELDYPPSR